MTAKLMGFAALLLLGLVFFCCAGYPQQIYRSLRRGGGVKFDDNGDVYDATTGKDLT